MNEAVATQNNTGTGTDSGSSTDDVTSESKSQADIIYGEQDNQDHVVSPEEQAEIDKKKDEESDSDEGKDDEASDNADGDKDSNDDDSEGDDETDGDDKNDDGETPVYELTFPEGFEVNDQALGKFTDIAAKHEIKPEAAQEFADLYAETTQEAMSNISEAYADRVKGWADVTQTDEEIGGKGKVFDEKMALAKTALDKFASDGLKKILSAYDPEENPEGMGLGNNPEVIRLFYRLGKSVGEDGLILGDGSAEKKADRESILYDN